MVLHKKSKAFMIILGMDCPPLPLVIFFIEQANEPECYKRSKYCFLLLNMLAERWCSSHQFLSVSFYGKRKIPLSHFLVPLSSHCQNLYQTPLQTNLFYVPFKVSFCQFKKKSQFNILSQLKQMVNLFVVNSICLFKKKIQAT